MNPRSGCSCLKYTNLVAKGRANWAALTPVDMYGAVFNALENIIMLLTLHRLVTAHKYNLTIIMISCLDAGECVICEIVTLPEDEPIDRFETSRSAV
jgi:hypothetical protein